jgi:hypothetical protein
MLVSMGQVKELFYILSGEEREREREKRKSYLFLSFLLSILSLSHCSFVLLFSSVPLG